MTARVLLFLLAAAASVRPAPAQPPSGAAGTGTCGVCHGEQLTLFRESVHAAVELQCTSCHGGDASIRSRKACVDHPGFLGIPRGRGITERCGSCHSDMEAMRQFSLPTDQLALFKRSPHGEALYGEGDPNAPTCVTCHGAHDVLPVSDPESPAHRARVPATCARCHADPEMMAAYELPADVYEKYARSAHGRGLLEHRQLRLPHCGDCHGTHGARPAGVSEVVNVCGHCHTATRDWFRASPHHAAAREGKMEECITCHGHHDVPAVGDPLQTGWDASICGRCHAPEDAGDPAWRTVERMDALLNGLREDIHGAAELLARARGEGIVTAEEQSYLDDARHTVVRAGPVSHAASAEQMELLMQKGSGIVERVRESVDVKLRRVRDRRLFSVVVFGVILLFVLLLNLKLRRAGPRADAHGPEG